MEWLVGYTGVYNVLDYAAMSFPSGTIADANVDKALGDSHQAWNEVDQAIQSECECQQ